MTNAELALVISGVSAVSALVSLYYSRSAIRESQKATELAAKRNKVDYMPVPATYYDNTGKIILENHGNGDLTITRLQLKLGNDSVEFIDNPNLSVELRKLGNLFGIQLGYTARKSVIRIKPKHNDELVWLSGGLLRNFEEFAQSNVVYFEFTDDFNTSYKPFENKVVEG